MGVDDLGKRVMIEIIKSAIRKIDELSKNKDILVVSHYDTDGVASAAVFARALFRWGKNFSLQIVNGLDEEFVKYLPEDKLLIFLDLASGSLDYLAKKKTEIFIFDHHEIVQEIPQNVVMINPLAGNFEQMSAAAICYLFAKQLSNKNKDLANLAILGMVGDLHDKIISKFFGEIISDSAATVKKGLMLYPSTRPLNRALEFSFNPFIPGVSGSREGVIELLRDAEIPLAGGNYKSLCELTEEEMTRLTTAILLKGGNKINQEILVGNLFLINFFNKLEDAREFSALINACSRMNRPEIALGFCLGNRAARAEAESIYIEYKQSLISALKHVSETPDKIVGEGYMIINARDRIKDTIIGTVASILSHSPIYEEGLIVVALAYNGDKVKVSARITGRKGRNVRELLGKAVLSVGGEVGGHPNAAGCLISREGEGKFIDELRRVLDLNLVKV